MRYLTILNDIGLKSIQLRHPDDQKSRRSSVRAGNHLVKLSSRDIRFNPAFFKRLPAVVSIGSLISDQNLCFRYEFEHPARADMIA
jgi:hypothetical protein